MDQLSLITFPFFVSRLRVCEFFFVFLFLFLFLLLLFVCFFCVLVLPGGCAFHKFSQNVTSFHKFSQHENRYKIVKAGEKW